MIQRIQSLFLALVAAMHLALYFLYFWYAEHEPFGRVIELHAGTVQTNGSSLSAADSIRGWAMALGVVNTVLALSAIVILFLYKKRLVQLRVTRIMLFLEVVFTGLIFYAVEVAKGLIPGDYEAEYGAGAFLPLASIILIFLAHQRILFDENLVRSADRLR